MDDLRIPWWLVLLIGISVIGLAGWQSSRWKPQMRLGALGLSLAYLVLLAYAIGGNPRGIALTWRVSELVSVGLCGISLISAVLLTGRPSFRGQLIWFGVMSLTNTALALVHAASLLVAATFALPIFTIVALLVKDCRHGAPLSATDLWPTSQPESEAETPYQFWLVAGIGLMIAVLLIGTNYFALHAELLRASPSRRHSALPARSRIRTILDIQPEQERRQSRTNAAIGQRTDIIALLGVLAFITIAAASSRRVTIDK